MIAPLLLPQAPFSMYSLNPSIGGGTDLLSFLHSAISEIGGRSFRRLRKLGAMRTRLDVIISSLDLDSGLDLLDFICLGCCVEHLAADGTEELDFDGLLNRDPRYSRNWWGKLGSAVYWGDGAFRRLGAYDSIECGELRMGLVGGGCSNNCKYEKSPRYNMRLAIFDSLQNIFTRVQL